MRYPSRVIAATLGVFIAISAEAQTGRPTSLSSPVAHRDAVVLLGFKPGVSAAQRAWIVSAAGGILLKTIGADTEVVYVGQAQEKAAIEVLKKYREVRYVEPDYIHRLDAGSIPNDSFAGNQWAISNTGQNVNGVSGTPGADERAPGAWRITTGTNAVVVAVLDTGVQYTHPDLETNIWNNPGGVGKCPAGTHGYNVLTGTCDPMDDDAAYGGHGTHVAGILGAVGNNGAGVSGVNWTTSIMAVKWIDGSNTGYTSDLISAMDWVIQAKQAGVNVRVVNDSATWPGTAFSQALSDAIDLLGSNDILFVTAAGNTAQNNDTTPRYPCSYDRPNMICAGATDQNDRLWTSSNYGITTVKLAAPGVNIYSTLRQSNYGYISGGSMAAPQVSGAAALILSEGYQSVANLRSIILNNVDSVFSLPGLVATGGRLDVCKAVPGCSAPTTVPLNQGLPVITGLLRVGSVVGASTGIWAGLSTNYAYQWYRCSGSSACIAVPGATSANYAPMAASDAGTSLAVAVTASNSAGSTVAFSGVSPPAASNASPFTVTSSLTDGATMSGPVKWQALPSVSVSFVQFYIDGTLAQTVVSTPFIYNNATTGYFDTTKLFNGSHVFGIRALSADNRTYGFYGATVNVENPPQNVVLPAISGSPLPGQTLATSTGTWTNSPSSFAYQWYRCDSGGSHCRPVAGASSAYYAVGMTDVGFTLRVAVTGTNVAGLATASSGPTSVVIGSGGMGGIALVQAKAVSGSGVGALSVSFSANNTAGNLIIAVVRMSTTSQTVSLRDSAGNVYIDAVSQTQSADGHQLHLFYAKNIVGMSNTVTATFSSGNNHPWLAIYEYSGLSVANPLDQIAHAQGSSASPDSGSTSVTSSKNELIFAATGLPASFSGTVTAASGYALQQQDTGASRAATEAAAVESSGSFHGGFNLSSATNWSTVVATFRSAAASSHDDSSSIALVQSSAVPGSGVRSLSANFPTANHAGNLIIAVVRMSTTSQTVSMADSAGNSYIEAASQLQNSDGHQLYLFYATDVAGSTNTVTATFSSTNNHPWIAIFEYSGLSATNPLDQTAHAQGSGASADSGPTGVTASPNELVFAAMGLPASYAGMATGGSGYVLQQQDTGAERAATESLIASSTSSFKGSFSLNPATNWSAIVATFRP